MDIGISEPELRAFLQRIGHFEHGCSEWLLVDPRTRDIKGCGFFDDPDLLLMAAQTYCGSYSLQVCRNPRPTEMMTTPGARNQFNRSLNRPSGLETLSTLTTTVFQFRSRGKQTLDQLGAAAATLVGRLGIAEYSAETSGVGIQIRILFTPSPLRRFGGPEDSRTLFARLEDHVRESMTSEEKTDFELLPASGPDGFDAALGVPQIHPHQGLVAGRLIYAPSDKPDPALDQLLADLHAGKNLRTAPAHSSAAATIARTEGLITDWDDNEKYDDHGFSEGGGILPKGASLKIESEEGKQAKGQLENLENLSKDSYMGRIRAAWRAPTSTKTLNARAGGGSRPGELWLIEGNSYRAVQDWLCAGMESLLKKSEVLVFWTSTRMTPGAFLTRGVERITGQPVEDTESFSDPTAVVAAHTQYKAQFKRPPVLFPHSPRDSATEIFNQIMAFRHSDEALQHMPCLVIVDGFDDLSPDPASLRSALRAARHLAQESSTTIWLGAAGNTGISDSMVDVHARLIVGEVPLRQWMEGIPASHPDRSTTAVVLQRLFPEAAQGRLPCVIEASNPHASWDMHGYHLYHPASGRFQNIVPKKEG